MANPARAGGLTGGRWLDISPERIRDWLSAFADEHGGAEVVPGLEAMRYVCGDGAVAECHVPFPPLPEPGPGGAATQAQQEGPGAGGGAHVGPREVAARIAAHASADRAVGVLLVRLGGYAAGVFTGAPPRLAASKTGARLVHGRSAAGGWSQQRFARRRENQAAQALSATADAAVAVFDGFRGQLDAVVLGGDRLAVGRLRDDQRLAPYFAIAVDRFLTVPEPRLAVLRDTPRMFRAVRVRIVEPAPRTAARR